MMTSLASLPGELLELIFSNLVLEPLPIDSTSRNVQPGLRDSQVGLGSLCLSSRLCCQIARPLLYRNIVLVDGKDAVVLLQTLLANPWLRPSIVHFACLVELKDHYQLMNSRRGWKGSVPLSSLRDASSAAVEKPLLEALAAELESQQGGGPVGGEFLDQVVAAILAMAENLADLVLRVPQQCDRHLGRFSSIERLMQSSAAGGDENGNGNGNGGLSSLRSIRLQGDPEKTCFFKWFLRGARGFAPQFVPYLQLPRVTKLELLGDSGDWRGLFGGRTPEDLDSPDPAIAGQLGALEDVRLYDSRTSSFDAHQLLAHTPRLRVFHWCPIHLGERPEPAHDEVRPMRIDHALLQGADRLESLRLETTFRGTVFQFNEDAFEKVTSLATFTRLAELRVDLMRLAGTHYKTPRTGQHPFVADLLPRASLRRLELVERRYPLSQFWTRGDRTLVEAYDGWVVRVLANLAADCAAGRLPRLEALRFQAVWRERNCLDPAELSPLRSPAFCDGITADFASAGVRFVIDWYFEE